MFVTPGLLKVIKKFWNLGGGGSEKSFCNTNCDGIYVSFEIALQIPW